MQINEIRSMFFNMKTKAYVIAVAIVALMTAGIIALVASPVQSIKMDVTSRGVDGEVAGSGGAGGVAGHGGYGGRGSVGDSGNYDDGKSDGYGGNGGTGGNANGGNGYTGRDGADQTNISIHKNN